MAIKPRIMRLLAAINRGVYEKETEIGLSLLAALAGQSILLLGPPGVAKSMVARRLKYAFKDARTFEYLMSRFSTPDEIFGPVSISRLKAADVYERVVEGYLPTADVVFLDEIWKAGPAIQNTLLTVVNEKIYRNGDVELHLPLKLLIGASNELPTEGEGLEALWDRFLIRIVSTCIRDESAFYRMLLDEGADEAPDLSDCITAAEYEDWQAAIGRIVVGDDVLRIITAIRRGLSSISVEGSELKRSIYVSDRRWKSIVRLLRASSFVHDRQEVTAADVAIAVHCLWNEPDELPAVREVVCSALFGTYERQLDRIATALAADLRVLRVRDAMAQAGRRGDHRDDDVAIFDHFYYRLDNHGTGHTYIFLVDYRNMPSATTTTRGILYKDPHDARRSIIRAYTNTEAVEIGGTEVTAVNLYRDDRNLYVNGVRYAVHRLERGAANQPTPAPAAQTPAGTDYEAEIDALVQQFTLFGRALSANLFVAAADVEAVNRRLDALRRRVAGMRVDVRKLLYGDA